MYPDTIHIKRRWWNRHRPAQDARWSRCGAWPFPACTDPGWCSWPPWWALSPRPGSPGGSRTPTCSPGWGWVCGWRTGGTSSWPRRAGSSSGPPACSLHLMEKDGERRETGLNLYCMGFFSSDLTHFSLAWSLAWNVDVFSYILNHLKRL